MNTTRLRIGCAGWTIPRDVAPEFPSEGSHLERYAGRFTAVEINSSFHRPHRRATYERWAASVPEGFSFSVKVPRTITHDAKLVGTRALLERFLDEAAGLGPKLGPVLVQLPPKLALEPRAAGRFFALLRSLHAGSIVLEPRHPTWFTDAGSRLMERYAVGRVGADPAVVPEAAWPAGHPSVVYFRLHGSPVKYRSSYSDPFLRAVADAMTAASGEAWCILDNTASGAAVPDALRLEAMLGVSRPGGPAGAPAP